MHPLLSIAANPIFQQLLALMPTKLLILRQAECHWTVKVHENLPSPYISYSNTVMLIVLILCPFLLVSASMFALEDHKVSFVNKLAL